MAEALSGVRDRVLSELQSRSSADVTDGLQVLAGIIGEERLPQDTPCLSGLQPGQALAPVLSTPEERLPWTAVKRCDAMRTISRGIRSACSFNP